MSISTDQAAAVPFHLSLNVCDLGRSVEFFRRLFDREPAKQLSDYAKFEIENPPLVLSLEPNGAAAGIQLNHLGIRLPNSEQLVELQQRLELAGISCAREDGVECCYARQTKFWITDPDRNLWEIYTIEENLDHRGLGQLPVVEHPLKQSRRSPAPAIWVHRLGEAVPDRLIIESRGVDQVVLEGSFNDDLPDERRQHLLAEARRILRPGGQLSFHGLSADRSIANIRGRLPGPAAAVECVPSISELIAALESAGFEEIHFTKLGEAACFTIDGIGLRETRVVACSPCEPSASSHHAVLYKGPFRLLQDDRGRTFARGQWVSVDRDRWERLRASPVGEHFLFRNSCD
ncbi:MAG TPA: ArsI/CadI family heavy metal resistance metalloenzyme [Pirellulales bacterium]|nr:ArsI/CadI family heavy metal resistance metalloenzyme [Pirellulales bacterium]